MSNRIYKILAIIFTLDIIIQLLVRLILYFTITENLLDIYYINSIVMTFIILVLVVFGLIDFLKFLKKQKGE